MIDKAKILTDRQRETWIDIAKAIGIMLVMYGHVITSGTLTNIIYVFHMPFFFALSGYLFGLSKRKYSFGGFVISRSKSLLLPYIYFLGILFLYWVAVEHYFIPWNVGPIWFLIVLYFDEIVFFFLQQ